MDVFDEIDDFIDEGEMVIEGELIQPDTTSWGRPYPQSIIESEVQRMAELDKLSDEFYNTPKVVAKPVRKKKVSASKKKMIKKSRKQNRKK